MAIEREWRFKATLDTDELTRQISEAKSQVASALSDALGNVTSPSVSGAVQGLIGDLGAGVGSVQSFASSALQDFGAAGATALGRFGGGVEPGLARAALDAAAPPEALLAGNRELNSTLVGAQMRGREQWMEGRLGALDAIENVAGFGLGTVGSIAGGILGAAGGPAGSFALGAAMGWAGDAIGRKVVQPFTNALFDAEGFRRHFMVRNAIDSSIAVGGVGAGGTMTGMLDPSTSSQVASSLTRRAYVMHDMSVGDLAGIASLAGTSGMLSGVTSGQGESMSAADSITARLQEIEGRVGRIRRQLGGGSMGAASALVSGIQMGLTEGESEFQMSQLATLARTSGTSRGYVANLMQRGSGAFQSVGLEGGAGAMLAEGSLLSARQLVNSGLLSPEAVMQAGGVEGIAQASLSDTAALFSTDFGGSLMLASGPGQDAVTDYIYGSKSKKDILRSGRESLRGLKTPVERALAKQDAANRMRGLNPVLAEGVQRRALIDQFRTENKGQSLTMDGAKAWLIHYKGMNAVEAEVEAAGMVDLQNDPGALEDAARIHREEQAISEGAGEAMHQFRQDGADWRRELMEDTILGAPVRNLRNFRTWVMGAPGGEASSESAMQAIVRDHEKGLNTIRNDASLSTPERRRAIADEAELASERARAAQREGRNVFSRGWSQTVGFFSEGIVNNSAEALGRWGFDPALDWVTERRLSIVEGEKERVEAKDVAEGGGQGSTGATYDTGDATATMIQLLMQINDNLVALRG